MAVKSQPEGYHSVTPYLIVRGGAKAIDFYTKAFGAQELFRMESPGGGIGHAEIQIGDSRIMLADEHPEVGAQSPATIGGSGVHLMIYVDDCDTVFNRAIAEGATETRPLGDEFYGDRAGNLVDPFGHSWTIATHKEDVSQEELERRAAEYAKQNAGA